MTEDRRSILQLLAAGKITADEAERLMNALEGNPQTAPRGADAVEPLKPKYLRVAVDSEEGPRGPTKVNIRVPMQLLRAGVRLSSLIPQEARDRVNESMRRKGHADFDIKSLKPENLETLIEQLNDLTVDVDQEKTKVRIYCE